LWRRGREIKLVKEEEGNKNCGEGGGKQTFHSKSV